MIYVTRSLAAVVCLFVLPAAVSAQDSKGQGDKEQPHGLRLAWTHRPSLRAGGMLRVDFRLKLQGDFREGDVIRVDASGGELRFSRQEPAAAAAARP